MEQQLPTTQQTLPAEQVEDIVRAFVMKVFGWMSIGLLATGVTALFTAQSEATLQLVFGNRLVFFGLIITQLVLVGWLSVRVMKMTAVTATTVFLAYSALTGLTLSIIFVIYTAESIASTFFVAAATFGLTALYGYVTKTNLASFGGILVMGLIGVVLASVVNLFLQNETIYWVTTYAGVAIFVGLTAYDVQKLKGLAALSMQGSEEEQKGAIIGALALYLDFINLFLLLLRILGRRR